MIDDIPKQFYAFSLFNNQISGALATVRQWANSSMALIEGQTP